MKRVVVTGVGAITPIGKNCNDFWDGIKEGRNGVDTITAFDVTDFKCKVAAEIKDFDAAEYIDKKDARKMDRYTQFGFIAAREAFENSGLDMEKEDPWRIGVITGSGVGGIETLETQHETLMTKGPGRVSPFFVPMMISNMAAAQIAIHLGAKGANENVVAACASGTNAIGNAFNIIKRGECDAIIAGGAEATITPLAFAGFCSRKAM